MELQTLFMREGTARSYSIRNYHNMYLIPQNDNGVTFVPHPYRKLGGLQDRFQRNCRSKNGSVKRPGKWSVGLSEKRVTQKRKRSRERKKEKE